MKLPGQKTRVWTGFNHMSYGWTPGPLSHLSAVKGRSFVPERQLRIAQRFNAGFQRAWGTESRQGRKSFASTIGLVFFRPGWDSRFLALQPTDESVGYFLSP